MGAVGCVGRRGRGVRVGNEERAMVLAMRDSIALLSSMTSVSTDRGRRRGGAGMQEYKPASEMKGMLMVVMRRTGTG